MSKFQEAIKETMKAELEKTVSSSMVKYSEELAQLVEKSVKEITEWVWDEKKIGDIEQAARQGATYIAVNTLIEKVIDDATQIAVPKIKEFLDELQKIIISATSKAIRELMLEKLSEGLEKG